MEIPNLTFLMTVLVTAYNKPSYQKHVMCFLYTQSNNSNRLLRLIGIFPGGTRTVRKSDYTSALALPKHMAGIFDEKCREKEKYREEQIGECPFSIPRHNLSL